MGWTEGEMRCKKHPMHRQARGVCPYCLREKLIKLSFAINGGRRRTEEVDSSCSTSLSSSPYSTDASSLDSSPRHDRVAYSEGRGFRSSGFFLKSRSVAVVGQNTRNKSRVAVEAADGKKKSGFWSKLLRSTGKKTKKLLLHSTTVKEMSSHSRIH